MAASYASRAEAIEREIVPALGDDAAFFNVEAVFDATFAWHVDRDGQGRELLGTAGFRQVVSTEEFWLAVEASSRDHEIADERTLAEAAAVVGRKSRILRALAVGAVRSGSLSEVKAAAAAGVSRPTLRRWLGK